MALWKQPQQQPFTTYRDSETGQWVTLKPTQPITNIFVEVPVYRDSKLGQWITIKSTQLLQETPC